MVPRFMVPRALVPAFAFILCVNVAVIPAYGASPENLLQNVQELLRNRIENGGLPVKIGVGERAIHAGLVLPRFYERRAYRPAWIGPEGPLGSIIPLIETIQQAEDEGLQPEDYHLAKIQGILRHVQGFHKNGKAIPPPVYVDLELLLTDAFLVYGSHLLSGRVDPNTIDPQWVAERRQGDLADVMEKALASSEIGKTLKSLLPSQPGYFRLRKGLARYREIARQGGWPSLPEGRALRRGDRDPRVLALRNRLAATGDLQADFLERGNAFDGALDEAVRRFQKRHGLEADGVVGAETRAALNVSAEERLRQIALNLERWRWLPQDLGRRYILVNIANFELRIVETDRTVLTMGVVVGKQYRKTPVFSHKISYLVLNPSWNIPSGIAIKDKLPLIQKDPEYLKRENIKVLEGWGAEARDVDPLEVDWSKVNGTNFRYRFRQEPGPMNALGRIKFMFPNRFNVYIHDTPSRDLFAKNVRTFSSGCIRVEQPFALAEYLLQGNSVWSPEKIRTAVDSGLEQTVPFPQPVPVHLLYWTAWVNEDGVMEFRPDIYQRDRVLDQALRDKPPLFATGGN